MLRPLEILVFIMFFSLQGFAGTWVAIDSETLRFEGKIDKDEYQRFSAAAPESLNTLIVNSGGGETTAALKIGARLKQLGINGIVDGVCASSCANYLFVAGVRKHIKRGWVGYHGNMNALYKMSWEENVEIMRSSGLTDEQIRIFELQLRDEIQREIRFFNELGISQALFDRSQRDDKGMDDGKVYDFLLPRIKTFERYGIFNVSGKQDMHFESGYNLNNVID